MNHYRKASDKMSKEYEIIAKVDSINQGDHFCNITVKDQFNETLNIKLEPSDLNNIVLGRAFVFKVLDKELVEKEKTIIEYLSSAPIENVLDEKTLDELLPKFYTYAPIGPAAIKKAIEGYLAKIENKVYKDITKTIYKAHKDAYYIHPAATKFHHAYVGGLSYHTLTMLKIADGFLDIYDYLDRDLVYAGIILHDIKKIDEMTGVDGEYTKEGLLIGHIVMGTIDIDKTANDLGYKDTEEVLLLKHTILSHHGLLNFGSPKKPQIGEALLIWYIDTIDSKLGTLGDVLADTKEGTFTQSVPVLDKMRFYKRLK